MAERRMTQRLGFGSMTHIYQLTGPIANLPENLEVRFMASPYDRHHKLASPHESTLYPYTGVLNCVTNRLA